MKEQVVSNCMNYLRCEGVSTQVMSWSEMERIAKAMVKFACHPNVTGPCNAPEDVITDGKLLEEGDKVLYLVKIQHRESLLYYYDAMYFPKWINIGGVYGINNEITIVDVVKPL